MRVLLKTLIGFSSILIATTAMAGGVTLIPVIPVPGSSSTVVFGINDNNIIVGAYKTPDGSEHGFLGPLTGSYTTFDVGTTGTEPHSISNDGHIVGFANASQGSGHPHALHEFERMPDGSVVPITRKKTHILGIAQGINNARNEFVGDDAKSDSLIDGYYGRNGKYKAALTLPFDTTETHPRGINNSNAVVGFFDNSTGSAGGFLLQNGVVTVINDPDPSAVTTALEGINDRGLATGIWEDAQSHLSAFTLDTVADVFTPIEVPGATLVEAYGLNKAGLVAVASDIGPFIYCPRSKDKCPSNGQKAIEETAVLIQGSPTGSR
jgi:hypothetical protein